MFDHPACADTWKQVLQVGSAKAPLFLKKKNELAFRSHYSTQVEDFTCDRMPPQQLSPLLSYIGIFHRGSDSS